MKKTAFVLLLLLCFAVAFAGEGFFISPELGFGYLSGSRAFKDDYASYRKLTASGLEVGLSTGYEFSNNLRTEAYFSYLFAFLGAMSNSPDTPARPAKIPQDMKYTDYKAGLGVGYIFSINAKNRFRISGGIDFAGISNHTYSSDDAARTISNEIDGNKVTSFGLYTELAWHLLLEKRFELVAGVHACGNFTGWIRTLENHQWINHFEESEIGLFSVFGNVGFCYNI